MQRLRLHTGLKQSHLISKCIFSKQFMFLALLMIGAACQGTKHLSESQKLYTGIDFAIEDKSDIPEFRQTFAELNNIPQPKPESKFLGMRPRLVIYNMINEPKKDKGFKYWLKYKIGKKPVFVEDIDPGKTARAINSFLYNKGHFNSQTTFEIRDHKKTSSILYIIRSQKAYFIDSLIFPTGSSKVERDISSLKKGSVLRIGDHYDLDLLKTERERITEELKDLGYFNFDPDYLIFRADSTSGEHNVHLYLQLKPETPPEAKAEFRLRNISIADDYSLSDYKPDTLLLNNYQYLSQNHAIKPRQVVRYVLIRRDSIYRRSDHINTLGKFNALKHFRYTNITYHEDSTSRMLDADILLSPHRNLTLSAEANAVAKSNNFAGPGVRLGIQKRNIFGGLETFAINLTGRFETQVSGENKGNTAFEINADAALNIPRMIPFHFENHSSGNVATSKFQFGAGIFQRTNLYQFNTLNTSFSYLWKTRTSLYHELKPIDISFTRLVKSSDEFREFLDQNPSLKKSFEEQFIIGSSYFISLDRLAPEFRRNYYTSIGIETSGLLAIGIMRIFKSSPPSPENPYKLFNNPISQFLRLRTDNRYYFKTGEKSILAARLFAAAGFPFGNSSTVPYVKQFFVGGTNSLRGFAARSVGPGTYNPPDSLQGVQVDQTGEIKIEGNLEYRFPLAGFLKGALFIDAGNIWLVNPDSVRTGGVFSIDNFYKELAISGGFGLRIDANILVVRFDWGFPFKKPWLPEGDRWVIRDIDIFSRDWRKKNLILNISIGYPF